MAKLIYDVGYNSKRHHKAFVNGKKTKSYNRWRNMIQRCYSKKLHEKYPLYTDCLVVDEWHDFQDFADWYVKQHYAETNYHLDKDLLIPNSKTYSPDTCCLIPHDINVLIIARENKESKHGRGVYLYERTGRYAAKLSMGGVILHLGYFDNPDEAHQVYRVAKEKHVKEKALEWKGRIADDVFEALMNWQLTD